MWKPAAIALIIASLMVPVSACSGGKGDEDDGTTDVTDLTEDRAPDSGDPAADDGTPSDPTPSDDGGGDMDVDEDTVDPTGRLIFFDDFEYAADRDDPSAGDAFLTEGGWSGVKSIQITGSHNGYLYTTDAVPGYEGALPGLDSTRVLVMEAIPGSGGSQTDFYLQYGEPDGPADAVPADVWFQFWIYIAHTDEQPSQVDGRNKFIYPCNDFYPCNSQLWLVGAGAYTYEPFNESPAGSPSNGDMFLQNSVNVELAEVINEGAEEWDRWKLGQTDISEHMAANRWTLVKMHIDTSRTEGAYEAWMRPMGGAWIKVVEWVTGTTAGFAWNIAPENLRGHRVIRMPTTIGEAAEDRPRYDAWIYMDDFAMATSDDVLPDYADLP
jgi:hypothetical protein